jgi:hypothetical protein
MPGVLTVSCKKSSFEDAYRDPSKVVNSTVGKQFSGMVYTNREYVVPSYWNYFVVLRLTTNIYTQNVGWTNAIGQYVPGAAAATDRWNNYYSFLAQYRELQKIYNNLTPAEQIDNKIYMISAAIYFYDHSQKVVDLHGDIPWADAGKLSTNGGAYGNSYAKYQNAEEIYSIMLDDLKKFSDELPAININPGLLEEFKTQDLINKGNILLWRKYCNSLRLRMLTRASSKANFTARANAEIAEILGNPSKYPLVASNDDNIMLKVYDLSSDINAKGFQTGLEDWNGNIAGKKMIDLMKTTVDPRLRAMFEPGVNAGGNYIGLDPALDATAQTALIAGGTLAIYNRSTISRNQYFPGILITAAEVQYLLAEYYLKAGNDAAAKASYETGIEQSINYYYWLRTLSNNNTAGALTPTNATQINAYKSNATIVWSGVTSAKLNLIATQKWLHYSVIQPLENWSEVRRLDLPALSFQTDNSSAQKTPPNRWLYPSAEATYNTANYQAVQAKDNLQTKIFWDVN